MKILIAVTAFNKSLPLKRLLNMLTEVTIPNSVAVDLVLSIDGGGAAGLIDVCHSYTWKHGDKKVISHATNLGLKNHMLKTFSLCDSYDGIVILEDDLVINTELVNYVCAAHNVVFDLDNVAGVSLYSQSFNENARMPFAPIMDGYSNYYLQLPSSWGVYLTKSQSKSFLAWYESNPDYIDPRLPSNIIRWSNKSWKKHFSSFLSSESKFFFYPRVGLSTTLSDKGTHHNGERGVVSSIRIGNKSEAYNFSALNESLAVYDCYCELLPSIIKKLNPKLNNYNFTVDFYGYKNIYFIAETEYILTLDNKSIDPAELTWGAIIYPFEINCIKAIDGKGIVLRKSSKRNYFSYLKSRWLYMLWSGKIFFNAGLISRLLGRG